MLTAEELGVPQEYVDALILTRDALRDGRIKHISREEYEKLAANEDEVDRWYDFEPDEFPKEVKFFNMDWWLVGRNNCGTAGCIGGTASALGKINMRALTNGLDELFYPDLQDWEDITAEQAVRAIDNYLDHGHPEWNEVIA